MNDRVATMINRVSNRQGERIALRREYYAAPAGPVTVKVKEGDRVRNRVRYPKREFVAKLRARFDAVSPRPPKARKQA